MELELSRGRARSSHAFRFKQLDRWGASSFNGELVTMPMSELFKIKNGKVGDTEAIGICLPYGIGSGWE